ncbi:8600_t:CDS:1 [Ambispora leptoticha]|uniref:8600_t:CDS:1 n=1 Tax=Ambispora leptoticha TaxID=144679 RepID=A0A9N9CSP5_9GLOM|nr:8600_t:CDS:1 [Ambispora leptoticha]
MTSLYNEYSYFKSKDKDKEDITSKKKYKNPRKNLYFELDHNSKRSNLDKLRENLENLLNDLPLNINDFFLEKTCKKSKELRVKDIITISNEIFTVEDINITEEKIDKMKQEFKDYNKEFHECWYKEISVYEEINSEIQQLITLFEDYSKRYGIILNVEIDIPWQTDFALVKSRLPEIYTFEPETS